MSLVAIVGRPNVGKSTLFNRLVGERKAIVDATAGTTRDRHYGKTDWNGREFSVIDTGGYTVNSDDIFEEEIRRQVMLAIDEADVILFLVDDSLSSGPGDRYILDLLKKVKKTPKILIINKIDLIEPEEYRKIYEEYEDCGVFDEIIGVSALKGRNTDVCVEKIRPFIGEGPMYFPKEMFTDNPMRFLVSEIIREKTLLYLKEEVPHGIAVEIEQYEEADDCTNISAVIYCEKPSHKGIIIGAQGKKLKGIGKAARLDIEPLIGSRVYLQLWVKVKANWRESDVAISNFGYKNDAQ